MDGLALRTCRYPSWSCAGDTSDGDEGTYFVFPYEWNDRGILEKSSVVKVNAPSITQFIVEPMRLEKRIELRKKCWTDAIIEDIIERRAIEHHNRKASPLLSTIIPFLVGVDFRIPNHSRMLSQELIEDLMGEITTTLWEPVLGKAREHFVFPYAGIMEAISGSQASIPGAS